MIRTSVSVAEQAELRRLARGRRVVEVGSLLGSTTVMLSRVAASVVSVDRHKGYGPSTLAAFHSNIARFGQNVDVRVGDALDLLPLLATDLVFIDLTGERGLTGDVIRLAPRNAVVCVHDLDRPGCDVARAIRDAGRTIAYAVGTLAVLA